MEGIRKMEALKSKNVNSCELSVDWRAAVRFYKT